MSVASSWRDLYDPDAPAPAPVRLQKQPFSRSPSISPIPEDAASDPCSSIRLPFSCGDDSVFDNHYDVKSALTGLLNCEEVRNDGRMRLWVQSRLMEAEQALKKQRRQRRQHAPSERASGACNEGDKDNCRSR